MKKQKRADTVIELRSIELYRNQPKKYNKLINRVYNLWELSANDVEYNINNIIANVAKNIGNQSFNISFLSHMISFRINKDDPEVYKRNIIDFLFTLTILSTHIKKEIKIQPADLPDVEIMNAQAYIKAMNDIIDRHKDKFTFYELSAEFANIKYQSNVAIRNIGNKLGISFSMDDIIDVMQTDELREIMMTRFKIPKTITPHELEDLVDSKYDFLVDHVKTNHAGSNLAIMFNAGLISKGQGRELFVHMGLKPDLDGRTLPITDHTNLLNGLISNVAYYIDGQGSRKAETMKLKVSKNSICSL